jgi:hypothetical protein
MVGIRRVLTVGNGLAGIDVLIMVMMIISV